MSSMLLFLHQLTFLLCFKSSWRLKINVRRKVFIEDLKYFNHNLQKFFTMLTWCHQNTMSLKISRVLKRQSHYVLSLAYF